MADENIKDKHGEEIHEGDVVGTRFRGGTREGEGNLYVTGSCYTAC